MAKQTLTEQLKAEQAKTKKLENAVIALLKFARQQGYLDDVCDEGQEMLDEVYELTNMRDNYTITLKLSTKSELSVVELQNKLNSNLSYLDIEDQLLDAMGVEECNLDKLVVEKSLS